MTADNDVFEQPEAPEPYTGETSGQMLKAAREARGLSQQQLADSLRLRVVIVQFIEADEYDKLAAPTFVRGYLRSIAKALEVDVIPVFEAYEKMGNDAPMVSNVKLQSFSRRKVLERNDGRLMLISYIIIAIVIGLVVIWWWQDSNFSWDTITGSDDAPTQTEFNADKSSSAIPTERRRTVTATDNPAQTSEEQLTEADGTVVSGEPEPLREEQVDQADMSTSQSQQPAADDQLEQLAALPVLVADDEDLSDERPADEGPTLKEADPQEQPSETTVAQTQLTLVFNEECWVKVTDGTAEDIAIGVKTAGYEMPLTGTPPFDIILCKPEAVELTYAGEPVDLSGYRRNRSVRLTLND